MITKLNAHASTGTLDPHAFTSITHISADEIARIRRAFMQEWPRDEFASQSAFNAWLTRTSITSRLYNPLWGLLGAWYPHRDLRSYDRGDFLTFAENCTVRLSEATESDATKGLSVLNASRDCAHRALSALGSLDRGTALFVVVTVPASCCGSTLVVELMEVMDQFKVPPKTARSTTTVFMPKGSPLRVSVWCVERV